MQSPTDTGLPTYLPPDPTGRYARIVVATRHDYGTDAGQEARPAVPRHATCRRRASAARVYAGGGPPPGVDFIDRAYGVFPWLVLGVLALTYLVLMRAFRSLLLPLKAVLLNLLSVGATYGLLVIAFRWGVGQPSSGSAAGQPDRGLDPDVPVRDAVRPLDGLRGLPALAHARAVRRDRRHRARRRARPERTGRIVTAAAAIMVAAFSGFMLGSLIGLVQFGFGLAAGDHDRRDDHPRAARAGLMKLMGEWNWYLPDGSRGSSASRPRLIE